MASIVKRGKKYSVVFNYVDENGNHRQKWEPPVSSKKAAQKRLVEIEYEMQNGTFILPTCTTVSEFLAEFVEVYGIKKWGPSMLVGILKNGTA